MTTYILKTGKQTVKRRPLKTITNRRNYGNNEILTNRRNYGNNEISPQQEQTLSLLKEMVINIMVDITFTTVNW